MPNDTALAGSPPAQTTTGVNEPVATDDATANPTPTPPATEDGENPTPPAPPEPERTYTKAELDAAAAQARRDAEAKIKRDKAVKDGEFQTLYQEEQGKAAKLELALKARDICDELEIPKEWRDSVVGDSEESLRESASTLKARLDKIIAEATKSVKAQAPGTPPPTDASSKTDAQKEEEGKKKTKELVNAAMGFGIKLAN